MYQQDILVSASLDAPGTLDSAWPPEASTSSKRIHITPGSSVEPENPPEVDETSRTTKKIKRKQYQACDACRLRRVKCERDSEEEPCKGCMRRGFSCTREYNTARASEVRSGRLLNQAKNLFGGQAAPIGGQSGNETRTMLDPQQSQVAANLSRATSSGSHPPMPAGPSRDDPPLFAFDSAEGRLGLIQSNEFVMNELVHCYRDNLMARNPITPDFDMFISRFEQSGRRYAGLSYNDKALSTVVIAMAARVTDLPVIAGGAAPEARLFRKGLVASEVDLIPFGWHRESLCRAFESRARACVEQHFFRKDASVDSIAALLAMQGIDDVDDPETLAHQPRIYSAAAVEQMRALVLKPAKTQMEYWATRGPMMRSLLIVDAVYGFESGRVLQVSDDDLVLFVPEIFRHTASEAAKLVKAANLTPLESMVLLADQMLMISRKMRQNFTSPTARFRNTLPPSGFFRLYYRDIKELRSTVLQAHTRAQDFHEKQSLRAVEMGYTLQLAFLHIHCENVIQKTFAADERARLLVALQEIEPELHQAVIDLSQTCKALHRDGMLMGNNLLWTALQEGAEMALKIPSNTEGGPPDFTLERKLECVENYLRCVRQLAFSWPTSTPRLPDLEHKVSLLKAQIYLETGQTVVIPAWRGPPIQELEESQENVPTVDGLDWLLQPTRADPSAAFAALLERPLMSELPSSSSSSKAATPASGESEVDDLLQSLLP